MSEAVQAALEQAIGNRSVTVTLLGSQRPMAVPVPLALGTSRQWTARTPTQLVAPIAIVRVTSARFRKQKMPPSDLQFS